jgi:hypothetical protein
MVILDYDLQHYVPLPEEGQLAVVSFINGDVGIKVSWFKIDSNDKETKVSDEGGFFSFEPGARYKAAITLTAKAGYTFDSGVSFYYPAGSVETQPGPNLDLTVRKLSTVSYYPTNTNIPIDKDEWLDLTEVIPPPASADTEGTVSAVNTPYYMGMVEWGESSYGNRPVAYTLLYAKSGYFFSSRVAFTHEDVYSMIISPSDGKTITLYMTFDP